MQPGSTPSGLTAEFPSSVLPGLTGPFPDAQSMVQAGTQQLPHHGSNELSHTRCGLYFCLQSKGKCNKWAKNEMNANECLPLISVAGVTFKKISGLLTVW